MKIKIILSFSMYLISCCLFSMDTPLEDKLGSLINDGDSSERKICNYKLFFADAKGTSERINMVIELNRRPSRFIVSQESLRIRKTFEDKIEIVLLSEKELQITATSAAHELLKNLIEDLDERKKQELKKERLGLLKALDAFMLNPKDLEMTNNCAEQLQKQDLNPLVADNNEIKIMVKQFTGKLILINIDANKSIAELLEMTYHKRQPQQEAATVTNYVKAVNLIFSGVELDHSKAIKDYKIKSGSTINEVLKSWALGSRDDFDWGTLSAESSITGEDISEPFFLNPGCSHTFDKAELREWVLKIIKAEGTPSCPLCKSKINPGLLETLIK